MLDQLAPTKHLIKCLESLLKAPLPYAKRIELSAKSKADEAAFRNRVQMDIGRLTAQQEKTMTLIQQIPDQTAQQVLIMYYGETTPYEEIGTELGYCGKSVYRFAKAGIDQMNRLLTTN